MRELGFTIESHSVNAFAHLQTDLLGFGACLERLLARHEPAFLGCVSANAAGPDPYAETVRFVFNDVATHPKITDHPGIHVEQSPRFIDIQTANGVPRILCPKDAALFYANTFADIKDRGMTASISGE
ncbi:hypothetical protein LPZ50_00465 [Bordetella petrii]|nr:hypothetical protein [Bordetella petrii]